MSDMSICPRCGGSGKVVLTPAEVIQENIDASHAQNEALRRGNLDPNELQKAAQGDKPAEQDVAAVDVAQEQSDGEEPTVAASQDEPSAAAPVAPNE